jgi:hypothetical protein
MHILKDMVTLLYLRKSLTVMPGFRLLGMADSLHLIFIPPLGLLAMRVPLRMLKGIEMSCSLPLLFFLLQGNLGWGVHCLSNLVFQDKKLRLCCRLPSVQS